MSKAQDLTRKLTTLAATTFAALVLALPGSAQQLTNDTLSVTVNGQDGSYQFGPVGGPSVLHASVGAQIDHAWVRAAKYPSHAVAESPFSDALGSGKQLTVICSGLADSPDLVYVLQLYSQKPYGTYKFASGTPRAKPLRCRQSAVLTRSVIRL